MARLFDLDEMRSSPTAWLFEGGARADAPLSFFLTHTPPGRGPGLHVHPYPEVFLVQEGTATFRSGPDEVVARAGQVVVVPAETPHGFKNTGEGVLRIVSMHPHREVVQTWLEDD
jgi:mannose-6-phosphate isomerase-like protein (cupin superfamily)